ncbi:MAG: PaaI family thioesterase [Bacteroidota bacterium]|nr:PaaI family thioesterase [Bacteroidota bacterium]
MQPKNPNFKNTILKKLEKQFFMQHVECQLTEIEHGKVSAEMPIQQFHLQQNGFVHGGVTSFIADLVMGFAAYTMVSENEGTVTSDLKVAYLKPGIGQKLIARGYVIKPGNLLYFCEADIVCINNGEETLIARAYSTMCSIKINP